MAFGTIIGLGQNAEHERITRVALACSGTGPQPCFEPDSMAALAGHNGSPGAVAAPDLSRLMFSNRAHCDSGDYLDTPGYPRSQAQAEAALVACRDWMRTQLDAAVTDSAQLVDAQDRVTGSMALSACYRQAPAHRSDKCRVIFDLGLLLHAAQDFYAHTNWVDRADPSAPISRHNPPGLDNSGPAPWISLRGDPSFPPGLISGCFVGEPESVFCGGRIRHHDLEKDEGQIEPAVGAGTTPRGRVENNFARAVLAAIADTRDKWSLLQERLADRYGTERARLMVCALTSDDPQRRCQG